MFALQSYQGHSGSFQKHSQGTIETDNEKVLLREVTQIQFLGRATSSAGFSPKALKLQNFLRRVRFSKSKRALQCYWDSLTITKIVFPRCVRNLAQSTSCWKLKRPSKKTTENWETFDSVNNVLSSACEPAIEQPSQRSNLFWFLTQASEAQLTHSWLRIAQIRKSNQSGKRTKHHLTFLTQNAKLLKRGFDKIQGIFRVCTHFVGSNQANKHLDG